MTFRELLEKYKNYTATPEERKQVETELEKYNALTEYLLEQDVDMEGEDLAGQQEELQKIDRSMKKRGRRIDQGFFAGQFLFMESVQLTAAEQHAGRDIILKFHK